jgi:hypothetical protein
LTASCDREYRRSTVLDYLERDFKY